MALGPNDVAQGFRSDCIRLIGTFEQLETVRFEGFCEIWKDLKFCLVFAGRKSMVELLEFCEDSLIIGKEFFLPPFSFKERIGGLYLLYALYYKMPVDGPKIRIILSEWQDIIEFRSEIAQAEHHDASYILAKLMSENAFAHCLFQRELGLEKGYRLRATPAINPYSVLPDIRELAGPGDLFERINKLSKVYEANKLQDTKLLNVAGTSTNSLPDLEWYDSNFGEKLLESVKQLENARKISTLGVPRPVVRHREDLKAGLFVNEKNDRASKARAAPDVIRTQLGHAFDTDSSDSENEPCVDSLDNNKTLPDLYDDDDDDYSSLSD